MIAAVWRSFLPDARRFLAGALLLELGHGFLWVLQNLYVRSLGFGEADAGTVLSAGAVGVVVSTIPAAALYDSLGARRCLVLSAVGAAIALVGIALSESLWTLSAWSAVQGAAFTVHRVVSAPFLVSVCRPSERTRLFGAEFMTHTVASAVGLVGAGLLADHLFDLGLSETDALRATLALGGLLSLSAVVPYKRLAPRAERLAAALGPLDPSTAHPGRPVAPPSPWRMFQILMPRNWHLWWRLALPYLVVGTGAGLTIPFINLYFTDRFGLGKDRLGLVMAASQLTMTVAVLGTPRLVARIGLLRATILTEFLSLPFFVILAFTTHFGVGVGAFILRTAMMNLSHPLWRNLMMEITPEAWRAAVNGVSMLAWNLGWAASNRWGGLAIERSAGLFGDGVDGYALPMVVTLSLYLLAILLEATFFWHVRHLGMTSRNPVDAPPAPG